MGGEIGMESRLGAGSTFWFSLPLLQGGSAAIRSDGGSLFHAEPASRGLRILLAEDLAMNRDLAVTMLTKAGHQIDAVVDGAAALAAVQERPYDIVLMDVQMPVMDGLEATRRIRALPAPAGSIPILALSAGVLAVEVERCLQSGMNAHLAKPLEKAKLLAAIDRWARPPDGGSGPEPDSGPADLPAPRPQLITHG